MTFRDVLHIVTNRVLLRRKEKVFKVYFLDNKDRMWQTLICCYTEKYAKKQLHRALEDGNLYLTEVKHIKDFISMYLDDDNIYVSHYYTRGD